MAQFQVYSASAGAGKTYSLVFNFLRICLADGNPRRFMRILAITFTNKAANEMKSRIVEKLRELAQFNDQGKEPDMMAELCGVLGISRERLSYRAEKALLTILHQYSAFSVSTIDRFTNRLIRSFAHDLQINSNYEVELDNVAMLSEAIDQMMAQLEENSLTTRFLLQFVNESLEEGRSPRPEIKLLEMGLNLFREDAFRHIGNLRSLSQSQILEARNRLHAEKGEIEKNLQQRGKELFDFICDCGLEKGHFDRGVVYNYIANIAEGRTDKWFPGKMVLDAVGGENFYTKGNANKYGPLFAPYEDEIRSRLQDITTTVDEKYPRYHLCELVLKDINTLAVLTEMDYHLQQVKETTNRLPIGEFNKLISSKLEGEPADYLFEKLGEKYHHYFIDEFQDTSLLQWKNVLPLINNAMASGGTAMIVGDGKQSIYRWRGGDVNQFIRLSNDSDPSNKVMVNEDVVELYPRETVNLPANYRSRRNIVEFNNGFFRESASLLLGQEHQELYLHGNDQKVIKADGGYVELKLLEYNSNEKEAYAEEQCEECLTIIEDARARGARLKDIAILVRSNQHGTLLAEHLLKNNIPIISPDSLLLSASKEVRALISFFRFLARPDDYQGRYDFLLQVSKMASVREKYPERHNFISKFITQPQNSLHALLQELLEDYSSDKLLLHSLIDKVYFIADVLKLDLFSDPFLQAFMDQVQDFHHNKGEDIAAFLRWWDMQGHKTKLPLPEHVDAVQIMSIHKSKGLQFGIAIIAFADWLATQEPGQSRAWLDLSEEDVHGIPSAWVGLKDPKDTPVLAQYLETYNSNKASVYLDNLNLLYVAFTRAVNELYVLSGEGLHNPDTRIYRYIKNHLDQKNEERHLEIGSKEMYDGKGAVEPEEEVTAFERSSWREKLKMASSAPIYWHGGEVSEEVSYGKKLHALLAEVDDAARIGEVLEKYRKSGKLTDEEIPAVKKILHELVNHTGLEMYYKGCESLFNEREILVPQAPALRPDRVVLKNGEAHILDYKTGLKKPVHRKQIETYRKYLTEMGYRAGDNVLVYIGNSPKVEKWKSGQEMDM